MKISDLFSIFNFGNFQKQMFMREVESAHFSKKDISLPPFNSLTEESVNQYKSSLKKRFFTSEFSIPLDSFKSHSLFDKYITKTDERIDEFTIDSSNSNGKRWKLDESSGYEFPDLFIWDKEILRFPKGVDPVRLWRLGSFNNIVSLGLKYLLTKDDSLLDKYIFIIEDFEKSNPFCSSIQWYDSETCSIRNVNLCLSLILFSYSDNFSSDKLNRVIKLILHHSVYIENYINSTKEKDYKYYIALLGLLSTAIILGENAYSKRIRDFVVREFELGIHTLSHSDGIFKGQSTEHQKLFCETFLLAKILLEKIKFNTTKSFDDKLFKAFKVLLNFRESSTKFPNLGDNIISPILFDYKSYNYDLIASGAYLFKEREFKYFSNDIPIESLLLFGDNVIDNWKLLQVDTPVVGSKGFTDGGNYFLTKKDISLFVKAGGIGYNSGGAPSHNDTFTFELIYKDTPFFVDAGTYSFYADKELRNQLRSVFNHNTFYVDNEQLAEFDGIFKIKNDLTKPKLLEWKSNNDEDILSVQHYAYVRLPDPVISKRTFHLFKEKNKLKIKDEFIGGEKHVASGNLLFHPDVEITRIDTRKYLLENKGVKLELNYVYSSEYFESFIHTFNYSSEYGKVIISNKIHYALSETLPAFYIIEINFL